MDQMMQDKTYRDIDNDAGPLEKRKPSQFPTFMFDTMIMSYGLKTIAVKVLVQLTNGIKEGIDNNPFGKLISRMLGLANPPLRADEISIVIRAHTFFKLV
jgi:hypothetical protein